MLMDNFSRKTFFCLSISFITSWVVSDVVKAAKPYETIPGQSVIFSPWSPPRVEYYFSSSLPLPDSSYLSRIRTAAQTWSQVQGSTFRYTEITTPDSAKTNQGVFTWEAIFNTTSTAVILGQSFWICFPGETRCPSRFKVALNSAAPDFYVLYQQTEGVTWFSSSSKPSSKQIDALSIATHELGHILGLDHTNLAGTSTPKYCQDPSKRPKDDPTMCSVYQLGSTFLRALAPDDINSSNGLQYLYP